MTKQTQSLFQTLKKEGLKSFTLNYDWENASVLGTVSLDEHSELKSRPDGSKYLSLRENGETIAVNLKAGIMVKESYKVVKVTALNDITNDAGEVKVAKNETRVFAI